MFPIENFMAFSIRKQYHSLKKNLHYIIVEIVAAGFLILKGLVQILTAEMSARLKEMLPRKLKSENSSNYLYPFLRLLTVEQDNTEPVVQEMDAGKTMVRGAERSRAA
ncbi:hypothetical protein T10_12205 [Trichinella papuae]|uniref:Uncharacterized protein n=1 Tax=Trichinella papuae TaxID=268474 RepID=A0A0V1MFN0_9BILA|nr:hypothetical protein T10_12205 [Trichinella papuae]